VANWLTRIFGSRNQRLVSQYNGLVRKINAFEPSLEVLSDADLAARTVAFREQLAAGKTLDDLLPEAFAVVREGQTVQKGDAIAVIGSTGRSTGTHVHFEVERDGNRLNPMR
jgi:preprotein translocase subunit SecA